MRRHRPLFDSFLALGPGGEFRWRLPSLLLAFYLGKGLCSYLGTILTGRVGQDVVAGLRVQVHEAVLAWPLGRFTRERTGDLLSRVRHGFNSALVQPDGAICFIGERQIMSHHDYSKLVIVIQGSQQFDDFVAYLAIQIARRFVGQQQAGA